MPRLQRLEDDDGPEDVDPCPECGVGAAERDLERRQVHDGRDVVLVERPAERGSVGDVSLDQRHALALVAVEDDAEPRVVAAEVVADRLLAVVEQRFQRPRAEAAERAGDERAAGLRQAARPGTR